MARKLEDRVAALLWSPSALNNPRPTYAATVKVDQALRS
jgi:hypothetical protein